MSDTDDTDDLLLIPPDFFSIHSDAEDNTKAYGPYYKVVDSLITQVNKLENRVNHIETSDSSFRSNSDTSFTSPDKRRSFMSEFRRYNSLEHIPNQDGYTGSAQSTPQKPRTRFKLNSLPSTPSSSEQYTSLQKYPQYGQGDRLQNTRRLWDPAPKLQNEMLSEIDTFFSNVKTIKKYNAARNLNKQFNSNKQPVSGLNMNDVDEMLHTMESQQREIESRLREKEHELSVSKGERVVNEQFQQQKVWREGDTKASVPDHGMGMRDTLYNPLPETKLPTNEAIPPRKHLQTLTVSAIGGEHSTSDLSARNSESVFSDSPTLSSSESTQVTAYSNQQRQNSSDGNNSNKIHTKAMEVLHIHKNLLSRNGGSDESKQKKSSAAHRNSFYESHNAAEPKSNFNPDSKSSLVLLSLRDLWNQGSVTSNDGKFDHSKFLNRLQEERLRRQHCEQLIQQLQTRTLELQERLAVAIEVDQAKDEAILQIHKSWEKAAGKIDALNRQIDNLEQQTSEIKLHTSHELSEAAKKVSHYEQEASKALNLAHGNQEKLSELERQNVQFVTQLQTCEEKLKIAESNYGKELNSNQQLSKILSQKEIELSESKNILSDARKEVAQSKSAVEICQTELTSMKTTQNQLEQDLGEKIHRIRELEKDKKKICNDFELLKKVEKTLQEDIRKQKEASEKNKLELKNFYQDQVEIVVREKLREFQSQLEKAESSLQDEVRKRELVIAKAAGIHIQQISEKHSLEVHLLEEKQKEEAKLYKLQLGQLQQQIDSLNSKLQQQQERKLNVAQQLHKMMEAQWLEAIKIINDDKSPVISQDKSTNTLDKLNYLNSRSYNNLEEILFKDEYSDESSSSDKITQINKLTSSETPLTSRPQKSKQQIESESQKYIQLLLNQLPGASVDEQSLKVEKQKSADGQTDGGMSGLYWHQQMIPSEKLNSEMGKSSKTSTKERYGKPPWK